jgi:hypothetical protein
MPNYTEKKTSSYYALKYLRKFQIPMIRNITENQCEDILKEIDVIQETLTSLKKKLNKK